MGLLPEGASFEELVADYFALVRGHGLMLSALDQELLSQWSELGAPFDVVARGIRRAAEKAAFDARNGEVPLRSLRACKREVEVELKKWSERAVGRHLEETPETTRSQPELVEGPEWNASTVQERLKPERTLEEERAHRIAKQLRKLSKQHPELAPGCERMLAVLDRASEDAIIAALLRSLPFPTRAQVLREARSLCGAQPTASARARKLSRRVHRAAVLRRALDLPAFW